MKTRRNIKKKVVYMLVLSIVCFLTGFIISSLGKKYNSPEQVTQRINSQIAISLSNLNLKIDQIASFIPDNRNLLNSFLNKNYDGTFKNTGIEILIYKNDSLFSWTDIVFAAPNIKDSLYFNTDLILNGSGYYLVHQKIVGSYSIICLQLIHYNYKYSNEYLPQGFFKQFKASKNIEISLQPGNYNIVNNKGRFLFSLMFIEGSENETWIDFLCLLLNISGFLFLISTIFWGHLYLLLGKTKRWLIYIYFVVSFTFLYALQFFLRFPSYLYELKLFSPVYYAYSNLLPSLADLLITVLLIFQFTYFVCKCLNLKNKSCSSNLKINKVVLLLLLGLVSILFFFLNSTINNIVLNSDISFRFDNFLSLSYTSYLGLLIIAIVLLTFIFLVRIFRNFLVLLSVERNWYILISVIWVLIYILFCNYFALLDFIEIAFLVFILIELFFLIKKGASNQIQIFGTFMSIVILSAFTTYSLNKNVTIKEHEHRKIVATHLSDARDNMAEYFYNEVINSIQVDYKLKSIIFDTIITNSNILAAEYIKEKYFSGYWVKYHVQITICDPEVKLNIKPENIATGCNDYFSSYISNFMRQISVPGLYFSKQSVDAMYYLGKIDLLFENRGRSIKRNIFIEIISNGNWKGLGYPELLLDKKLNSVDNLAGYSYAFYRDGELVKNAGVFSYDIEIKERNASDLFITDKGFSHYFYKPDSNTTIVLSFENQVFTDIISPFYYVFILQFGILLTILLLQKFKITLKIRETTFRFRLQIILISMTVISSMILVIVSLLFIEKLNNNKNIEILHEKLNSVLIDIENRFANNLNLGDVKKDKLSELLLNLSNTYFTDINIFNEKGFLLASSRDQIFTEGMISEQINQKSVWQLLYGKKAFIVQREEIGNYSYLSAYAPIRNKENKMLGYINLPYFAKQEEIHKELSGLISAYANIYLIILIVSVTLALVLSRTVTKPLQLIANQFGRIKIGKFNEKIVWKRNDEIGSLVKEYNRMIDELEKSAELLARSERESAWREMAKQVAHEIKNPLTPIKLNVQLLLKAWQDKAPDWEERLRKFSQTLILQIDTLSSTATEFSDFAQNSKQDIKIFDVLQLLEQTTTLFSDQTNCSIYLKSQEETCFVRADKNHILRVFNNLIKNAIQAIPKDKDGVLTIELSKLNNNCIISFKDNGTGIEEEKKAKIFSPNFTTKTTGMGLGLAIVKNIIDNSSGQIWFETKPSEGTVFYISLPLEA